MAACPCGTTATFGECCRPYLRGDAPAPTAAALMRSRYTAYVRRDWAYLLATWHPSTRPASVDPGDVTWQGLEVVATEAGGPADSNGTVTFVAHFTSADGMSDAVRETSRFVQTDGRWLYVDETPPQRR